MAKNKALKKARKAALQEAAQKLEVLTAGELDNLQHEARREIADPSIPLRARLAYVSQITPSLRR